MVAPPAEDSRIVGLLAIILEHRPTRVWLFGSRGQLTHEPGSDIDFAVEGVPAARWPILDSRLRENDITLLPIDLVRWEEAHPLLKTAVETSGRLLYERMSVPA